MIINRIYSRSGNYMVGIENIRLLTNDEYLRYHSIIPSLEKPWWLMPYANHPIAISYCPENRIIEFSDGATASVRPVMECIRIPLKIAEEFDFADLTWIVLSPKLAISKIPLFNCKYSFNHSSDYSHSYVKTALKDWFRTSGIDLSDDIIGYCNKTFPPVREDAYYIEIEDTRPPLYTPVWYKELKNQILSDFNPDKVLSALEPNEPLPEESWLNLME